MEQEVQVDNGEYCKHDHLHINNNSLIDWRCRQGTVCIYISTTSMDMAWQDPPTATSSASVAMSTATSFSYMQLYNILHLSDHLIKN